MQIVVVNEQDEAIGVKERSALSPSDIYRVAVLWITNATGDMLLAQRSAAKKWPGTWGATVAGTVEADENYDTNIVKEAKEEIGLQISIDDLIRGPKYHFRDEKSNHFSQSYFYTMETSSDDLVVDQKEIAQLQWFPRAKLKDIFEHAPEFFSPSARRGLKLILEERAYPK